MEEKEEVKEETQEEIKEEVKEKEEPEKPVEKEKKSNSKGSIILIGVLVVIILALMGYLYYDNFYPKKEKHSENTNTEENQTNNQQETNNTTNNETTNNTNETKQETKSKAVVAIGKNKKVGLFDENFNLIWSHDTSDYIPYGDVAIDGNYVYFAVHESGSDSTMIANLYRVDIEKQELENLDIKLKHPWYIHAENNQLLYNSLYSYYLLDINTKKDELLEVEGNNKDAFINGNLLYTKKDGESLNIYNLKTKEDKKIDDRARIVRSSNTSILYVNSENKYYLYNVKDDSKTFILTGGDYALTSGDSFSIELYKNTVYVVKNNTLYTVKNDKMTELYKFSLKEDESVSEVIVLGNNKYVLQKYIDNGPPCTSDICGPTGEFRHIILNLNTKTVEEIETNEWLTADGYVVEYVNN